VATWEKLTGIAVDHFMMIDFAGVVSMADAVGGVPVCVKSNVYDKLSGLRLAKGTHTVQGQQALQWLRTRHGFEDGSDIGRTHAQHLYMNAMVRRLKAGTKLTDPGKLMDLAEAATGALTVDTGLGSVAKLYSLAKDLKEVPTDGITMTTMPWAADPENPTAHVVPTAAATKLFTLLRNDQAVDGKSAGTSTGASAAPTLSASRKAAITVTVQNGTSTDTQAPVSGRAAEIAGKLTSLGYAEPEIDDTLVSRSGSAVQYAADDRKEDAQAVAASLGLPASAVKKSSSVKGVTLVIGADWTTGATYPKTGAADTKQTMEEAAAVSASDETACMKVNPGYTW
jgi:hypothetical protein